MLTEEQWHVQSYVPGKNMALAGTFLSIVAPVPCVRVCCTYVCVSWRIFVVWMFVMCECEFCMCVCVCRTVRGEGRGEEGRGGEGY